MPRHGPGLREVGAEAVDREARDGTVDGLGQERGDLGWRRHPHLLVLVPAERMVGLDVNGVQPVASGDPGDRAQVVLVVREAWNQRHAELDAARRPGGQRGQIVQDQPVVDARQQPMPRAFGQLDRKSVV